jgi:hypothetical protein
MARTLSLAGVVSKVSAFRRFRSSLFGLFWVDAVEKVGRQSLGGLVVGLVWQV